MDIESAEITGWRKSSFSDNSGPYCVEVGDALGGQRAVRNSNRPQMGHVLFTREEWNAFVLGVKDGQFD